MDIITYALHVAVIAVLEDYTACLQWYSKAFINVRKNANNVRLIENAYCSITVPFFTMPEYLSVGSVGVKCAAKLPSHTSTHIGQSS